MNTLEKCLAAASEGARELRALSEPGRRMVDAEVMAPKDRQELLRVQKRSAELAGMASAIEALVRLIDGKPGRAS